MQGKIISVNISSKKGVSKHPVQSIILEKNYGVKGDAHGGTKTRQVSLLSIESIQKMKDKGSDLSHGDLSPGDFAENITFSGLDFKVFSIGTILKIGKAELDISQIGKKCHIGCDISKKVGDCIMPREGLFARVLKGGEIKARMDIIIIE